MRVTVALVLAAACGRVGFSPRIDPCPVPSRAPDPLMIDGRVIAYQTFTTYDGVGGVTVTAFDAETAELLGSARSAGNGQGSAGDTTTGRYSLAISGGIPRRVRLELTSAVWGTTAQYTDVLGSDLEGNLSTIWGWGALGTVYGAVGLTLPSDASSDPYGTLDIQVLTCDGSGIGGALVSIDPDPTLDHVTVSVDGSDVVEHGQITYLGSNNEPQTTPGIVATNPAAVGFYVAAGADRVTVTAPGYAFPPFDVDVTPAPDSSVIVIRPFE